MNAPSRNMQLKTSILREVYYKGAVSLTDLSKQVHKSLPVVSQAVTELVEQEILLESGVAPSTGGRRPVMFHHNPESLNYMVCVAMDQFVARVAVYDQLRERRTPIFELLLNQFSEGQWVNELLDVIEDQLTRSGIARARILGVGVGMPGFVNSSKGINESLKVGERFNLRDYMSKELELPVFIENDSSLIALAELRFGLGRRVKNIMVVNIGWGTGLGMIINGELYRGHSNHAGEFSHIPLSQGESLCSCGKRGCLEVETSILSMVAKIENRIAEGEDSIFNKLISDKTKVAGDHFMNAAVKGDPLAVSILSESAYALGKGISTLIHILNPEKVVLSGRGSQAGKMYLPAIQQAINVFCIQRISDHTSVEVSGIGHEAELIGAGCLVIDNCVFKELLNK